MSHAAELFLVVGVCLSLILVIHLWIKRRGGVYWRFFWSFVLFFPYLGPVLYFAFFDPPPPKPTGDRLTDDKVSIY